MSGANTAAVFYAATISLSTTQGAVPEDAKEKRHHNKSGVGFVNPWDSYKERGFLELFREFIWYEVSHCDILLLTLLSST
jgi:hypothetical protein